MARRVRARYRPNHRSFGAFMVSSDVHRAAVEAAHDVAAIAAVLAEKDTGAYSEDFKVDDTVPPLSIRGSPRAIAVVFNENAAAPGQEFGDRWDNPPRHTLKRAGDRIGDVQGDLG